MKTDLVPPHAAQQQPPARAALNDGQKRAVLFALLDLHRHVADLEAHLAESQNPSAFCQFVNDLSPTEAQVVLDYFRRIRERILAWLAEADISPDVRRTSLRWALQVGTFGMHTALAYAGARELRGYGTLDEGAAALLGHLQQDLGRLIDRVSAYLRQGAGRDLEGRLARLEQQGGDAGTLAALDRVITRRGLVEFRPLLDQLVGRLEEAPRFEVAVFGRVSSGKSSLLNHVAGRDVLPVGVTPVTAVPTRLVRGDELAATVTFAEEKARPVPVEELWQYASEEGNPGNRKRVTGVLVRLPSPRLRDGVVLVDTPGVGSLARAGSAETFAYLPRCDLGVVLIDAAPRSPDDLALVRLLCEAAVPAQVVLSKADLLTPADRERTVGYVREQVDAHDRRVQAWLKECLRQLVESYEAQAEVYREQARRQAAGGDAGQADDVRGLESDIRGLREAAPEADAGAEAGAEAARQT